MGYRDFDAKGYIIEKRGEFEVFLARHFRSIEENSPQRGKLLQAIRYSLINGGKRMRPILLIASCEWGGAGDIAVALPAAAAVEMVHTYSIIHDDLPAMDNDDLRRGKPSLHRAFGEGLALLSGDALLGEAFHIASNLTLYPFEVDRGAIIRLLHELGGVVGFSGMVLGQAMDTGLEHPLLDLPSVELAHILKTAGLIRFCFIAGGLLAGLEKGAVERLGEAGRYFGTAFQTADDIADPPSSPQGSNILNFLDAPSAMKRVEDLLASAIQKIEEAGLPSFRFSPLLRYYIERGLKGG